MGLSIALLIISLAILPVSYGLLCNVMRRRNIPNPPYLHYFFVFGAFGGGLLATALSQSPLGLPPALCSIFLAPIAILISSWSLFPQRHHSRFHKTALVTGAACLTLLTSFLVLADRFPSP